MRASTGFAWPFIVASILLWSTVAAVFKLTLRETGPVSMLLVASWVSLLALLVIVVVSGQLQNWRHQGFRRFARSGLSGVLNPLLYYLVLFDAYDRIPAQQAQPLNFTWPIMITLLSAPLLGQSLSIRQLAGTLVSYLGVLFIVTYGSLLHFQNSDPTGTTLALGSSVIWALYWIFNLKDRNRPLFKLANSFLIGSLLITLFATFTGKLEIPTGKGLAGSVYVGLFEMGVTFYLWLQALEHSSHPGRTANLMFIAPFISLFWIQIFTGEMIHVSAVVGLILIMAGILYQQERERRHDH